MEPALTRERSGRRLPSPASIFGPLALVVCLPGPGDAAPAATNHLAGELSPYLQRHARDPVAWHPWGKEAFDRASREGRPILLSIGALHCHACEAYDRAAWGDPETARVANGLFVAVKVDREERPDVDELYPSPDGGPVTRLLDARGFDLPDPSGNPEPGDPGALRAWLEAGAAASPASRGGASLPPLPRVSEPPTPAAEGDAALVALLSERLAEAVDATSGFHGAGFSLTAALLFELGAPEAGPGPEAASRALEALARSPRRDHVGGGFFPPAPSRAGFRFEKLLADNALLLRAYALAYSATGRLLFRDVAQEAAEEWLVREMRDASGGFWNAVSGATAGEEGRSYRWTREDVVASLGAARAGEWLEVYALAPPGVFRLSGSPFAGLAGSREVLLARRNRRVRPELDARITAAGNGLALSALAASGTRLGRGSDLEAARRAAADVLARLGPPARLRRYATAGGVGKAAFLQDHAYLAAGLLDLHEATGEARWRSEAEALVDAALARFGSPDGGFLSSDGRDAPLPLRRPSARDGERPSPNAVLAGVLLRLGKGDERFARLGRRALRALEAEQAADPLRSLTLAAAARLATPGPPPPPASSPRAGSAATSGTR